MGKSAKFYKRPSKKEKEGITVKKLVEPSAISKKSSNDKKITVPASMFQDKAALKSTNKATKKIDEEEDVAMDIVEEVKPKETKKTTEKEAELPDYVDLFSGKKTYKKIPKKRK